MRLVAKKYAVPFLLITSLFFIWGFARAILDVLNKHFQDMLSISISQSALVQAMTYLGYFLMALPAGVMMTRRGYRLGVVIGLLLFAAGGFLFIPGEHFLSFPIFLIALFVIGCGLAMLETAANPYVTELGDRSTASSRLNLAQSFNGLGCILGPVIMGGILFADGGGSVALPYTVMSIGVTIVAIVFMRVKLPELGEEKEASSSCDGIRQYKKSSGRGFGGACARIWGRKNFRMGILALFCYEISEISINSLFINYVLDQGWMDKQAATALLSFGALGLFMLARVAGSLVMSKVKAVKVLMACGIGALTGALLVVAGLGVVSGIGLFMCYLFEAVMFPTIFALTIEGVGEDVKIASSFLMMTPVGGAVGTVLMGLLADTVGITPAFLIPAAGYAMVIAYSMRNRPIQG